MELIDRQIEAVKETLEQVIGEYRKGEKHHMWRGSKCPLCGIDTGCSSCPLYQSLGHCMSFYKNEGYVSRTEILLEDIAGFLQSLLIGLEGVNK